MQNETIQNLLTLPDFQAAQFQCNVLLHMICYFQHVVTLHLRKVNHIIVSLTNLLLTLITR